MKIKKTLYILRHGKAETGGAAQEDATRALNARGIAAAHTMGLYMRNNGVHVQKILCSEARRTRQTWEHVSAAFLTSPSPLEGEGGVGGAYHELNPLMEPPTLTLPLKGGGVLEIEYSAKLYLASMNETLSLLAHTPEDIERLLLVGHNPGLHQLCVKLARTGSEKLLDDLSLKLPTCAFVAIGLEGAWKNIAHARGELLDYTTPQMLTGGGDD